MVVCYLCFCLAGLFVVNVRFLEFLFFLCFAMDDFLDCFLVLFVIFLYLYGQMWFDGAGLWMLNCVFGFGCHIDLLRVEVVLIVLCWDFWVGSWGVGLSF